MNLKKNKHVSQIEVAQVSGKARQWINYLIAKGRLDTEEKLGRTVIVNNRKLKNFLKESSSK